MLIIFDLDDTLIQTSAVITPWRFEKVIQHLDNLSLLNQPPKKALEMLVKEHQTFDTSILALEDFFDNTSIDKKFFQDCLAILNGYDEYMPAVVFDGVYDLLKSLKNNYILACVTSGAKSIQTLKLEKTGLHLNFFDDIVIVEVGDKQEAYKSLFEKHNVLSAIVIGDRVSKDLLPAKKLGFTTALVQQGRGQYQKIIKEHVDFVIQDVTEVPNLIKSIQNP